MAGLGNTKWMVTRILARIRSPVKKQTHRRLDGYPAVAVVYKRDGVKDTQWIWKGIRNAVLVESQYKLPARAVCRSSCSVPTNYKAATLDDGGAEPRGIQVCRLRLLPCTRFSPLR
jgi:hypothetical protein